jgi:hypothetical protein
MPGIRRKEKIMKSVALGIILVLGISATAYAEVLFSPSLPAIYEENQVHCSIVNVDTKARWVVIEVMNPGGQPVGETLHYQLPPGSAAVVAVGGNLTPNYCRFEVEGHRHMFRASISVLRPNVGMISALPAR